jgi:hypothetical protein
VEAPVVAGPQALGVEAAEDRGQRVDVTLSLGEAGGFDEHRAPLGVTGVAQCEPEAADELPPLLAGKPGMRADAATARRSCTAASVEDCAASAEAARGARR